MSSDLLHYCIERLHEHPRVLNIHQPLDSRAHNSIPKLWAKARFEEQQKSIIQFRPDHPDYGRGYLWPYELEWTEAPDSKWSLRIVYNRNHQPTPREAILLASVIEAKVRFPGSLAIFTATKSRMLGRNPKRKSGAVLPSLRVGVANVQFSTEAGVGWASAWNMKDVVTAEFD